MIRIAPVDIDILIKALYFNVCGSGRYEVHDPFVGRHLRGAQPVFPGEGFHNHSLLYHGVHNLFGAVTPLLVVSAAGRSKVLYRVLLARKRAEQFR